MAAFTAALIGLALAGGLAGGKAMAGSGQDNSGDPSKRPHATLGGGDTPPAAPPSLALTGSSAAAAASNAAARARKKATAGSLIDTPITKNPAQAASSQAAGLGGKTLLGY